MSLPVPCSHLDLLTRPIHGVLTTMMLDGQPQSSLVWCDYDGECARVNTTLERQKGRNLSANPKDPEQARAAGFAKPIIAGNQVFSILWKRFIEPNHTPPVSMSYALKRPIFWDEEVTFARTLAQPMGQETVEVRNSGGKTAIECKISSGKSKTV